MASTVATVHEGRYRGFWPVTVTCTCGWVSENHRSRGRARRAYGNHLTAKGHLTVDPLARRVLNNDDNQAELVLLLLGRIARDFTIVPRMASPLLSDDQERRT